MKKKTSNPVTAGIGTVLSALAIIADIYAIVTFFAAVEELGNDLDDIGNKWDSYSECVENAGGDPNALSKYAYDK